MNFFSTFNIEMESILLQLFGPILYAGVFGLERCYEIVLGLMGQAAMWFG
jgi:hypothetical protein